MAPTSGKEFYASFLDKIRTAYAEDKIQDGQFGAMMNVSLTNDGPVTVTFDSRDRNPRSGAASGASTPVRKTKAEQEEIGRAKVAARAAKKAEYEARLAAGLIPGKAPAPAVAAKQDEGGQTAE